MNRLPATLALGGTLVAGLSAAYLGRVLYRAVHLVGTAQDD